MRISTKPTVFLDSSAIVSFLAGRGAAAHLFDDKITSQVRFAINPVVIQELVLRSGAEPKLFTVDNLDDLLSAHGVAVLEPNLVNSQSVIENATKMRNKMFHSNDILILASALDCDYVVTEDSALYQLLGNKDPPVITTPNKFIDMLSRNKQ